MAIQCIKKVQKQSGAYLSISLAGFEEVHVAFSRHEALPIRIIHDESVSNQHDSVYQKKQFKNILNLFEPH